MSIRVEPTGIQATSLTETIAELRQQFSAAFGGDLALEDETPQGQITAIMATALVEVYEAIVALGNAHNVDTASGIYLDDLGSLLGIERRQATPSRLDATLTGVADTIIPAGRRVADEANNTWLVPSATTITTGGTSTVLIAATPGPTALPAAGRLRIATPLTGWETAVSAGTGSVGEAIQSNRSMRRTIRDASARNAQGPLFATYAALADAGATVTTGRENRTAETVTVQSWPIPAHSILIITDGLRNIDATRVIEAQRAAGAGTVTAVVGAARTTTNITALRATNTGTITWGGTDYENIDLTSATTGDDIATLLTAAVEPVTFVYSYDQFIAVYPWTPTSTPTFATSTLATALGLNTGAIPAPGPFIRPRRVPLTVTVEATATREFPSNGLELLRLLLIGTVEQYQIGSQVWANDLLAAAESVTGTRVTSLTVKRGSTDVSGVEVPLDIDWTLPVANLTISITTV